jgi:hypothetical protein
MIASGDEIEQPGWVGIIILNGEDLRRRPTSESLASPAQLELRRLLRLCGWRAACLPRVDGCTE